MAKLRVSPPRLRPASVRVGFAVPTRAPEQDRNATPWRRWYSLAAWKALRLRVFARDRYTCQRCRKLEGDTSQLVGDHKVPHRGDRELFFDEDNVWTLCVPCHSGAKQREEQASLNQRGVWD